MNQVKQQHASQSEVELIKMTVVDENGNTRENEMLSIIKPDGEGNLRYLIQFLSPPEVNGVTLLTHETSEGKNKQWLYLPALGQAKQITGSEKSGYFMGSDFTFQDLRKENPKSHQYYRLRDGKIGNEEVYVIMSAPANVNVKDTSGYANRLLYVDKDTHDIRRIEFYEEGNSRPIKLFEAHNFEGVEVDGPASRPGRVVMNNHQNNTYSVMTLKKSRLNAPVDDGIFEPQKLSQWTDSQQDALIAIFEKPQPKNALQ